jgi:hypothetical protein
MSIDGEECQLQFSAGSVPGGHAETLAQRETSAIRADFAFACCLNGSFAEANLAFPE